MIGEHRSQARDWDEGVASERTGLAWERTAIASLAVAALVVRAGVVEGLLGLAIPVATLLVAAATVESLFSHRIYVVGHPARAPELHPRAILALAAVTLTVAGVAVALALAT